MEDEQRRSGIVPTERWDPTQVRQWVERHGGNVSALARRLGIARTHLQALMAERGDHQRVVSRQLQAHMETLDAVADMRAGE